MRAPIRLLVVAVGCTAGLLLIGLWFSQGDQPGPRAVVADPSASPARSAPSPPRERPADLFVAGTVTNTAARGIPDAQVCASCAGSTCELAEHRTPWCVSSDARGAFRLDGLERSLFHLGASAPGYTPAIYDADGVDWIDLRDGRSLDDVAFVLMPGHASITGEVRDQTGGAVPGAVVSATLGDEGSAVAATVVTGPAGRFELRVAPGPTHLITRADGYTEVATEVRAPYSDLTIVLVPEAVLAGRVIAAQTGEPLEGLTVWPRDEPITGATLRPAITDHGGRFELTGLPPGRYMPYVKSAGWFGRAEHSVVVGLMQTTEGVVIAAHAARFVSGRVTLDGTQELCTTGTVALIAVTSDRDIAHIDPDGRARFETVLPGTYRVEVRCEGCVPHVEALMVDDSDIDDVVWNVRSGSSIAGSVVDTAGVPVANIGVSIRRLDQLPADLPRRAVVTKTRTALDGSFRGGELAPGIHRVSALSATGDAVEVTVEPGREAAGVQLVVEVPGAIHGEVVDEHGAGVASRAVVARSRNIDLYSRSDARGRFFFDALAPGPYTLRTVEPLRRRGQSRQDAVPTADVEVEPGGVASATLTLAGSGASISGWVRSQEGAPLSYVRVVVQPDGEAPMPRSLAEGLAARPRALTDAEGAFEIRSLRNDVYNVSAYGSDGAIGTAAGVHTGSEVTITIAAAGTLAGTVSSADHTAPPTFSVGVKRVGTFHRLVEDFYRTDGSWRISGLPAGEWDIVAQASTGKGSANATLEPGQVVDGIVVGLQGYASVSGQIIDFETDAELAEVRVVAFPLPPATSITGGYAATVSDAAGRFGLEGVPAGAIGLLVHPPPGYLRLPQMELHTQADDTLELGPVRLMPEEPPP